MRPQALSQTGVGSSAAYPLDTVRVPFSIGMGVIVTGTVTYTVQHTFDDPFAVGGLASAVWFNHPSLAALSANADGNYAYPVTAVRITVSAGTGTASLRLIQAGPNK